MSTRQSSDPCPILPQRAHFPSTRDLLYSALVIWTGSWSPDGTFPPLHFLLAGAEPTSAFPLGEGDDASAGRVGPMPSAPIDGDLPRRGKQPAITECTKNTSGNLSPGCSQGAPCGSCSSPVRPGPSTCTVRLNLSIARRPHLSGGWISPSS